MRTYINNYREKTLLIANYFCEKSRKELTPAEVYDMWCNWFSGDFRIDGHPTFKIENDKLVFRKKSHSQADEIICIQYNKIFASAYKWIKKSVENKNNNKQHFKNELDRERKKGFAKIITLAKPMGLYITLSQKNLYKNRLGYYSIVKHNKVLTSGDCDKIIEYLQKMKKEDNR